MCGALDALYLLYLSQLQGPALPVFCIWSPDIRARSPKAL